MKPRDRVLGYLQAFATGDPEAVVAHVTEDFENHQVSALGASCQGRETYRSRLSSFLADFEALRYDAETIIAEDDHVAVTYKMRCRYAGKPIVIDGVMVMTLRDDLIASRADYWDGATFQKQIEAHPAQV